MNVMPARSNPLNLMPNSFTTPTLLQPPADPKGLAPGQSESSKPAAAKPKPKPKVQTNKPPKAKTPMQEAKGVSWIYFLLFNLNLMKQMVLCCC